MSGLPGVRVVLLVAMAAGCAPPRVDTVTDDSFTASLARVRRSVPRDRRAAFDQAVLTIGAQSVTLRPATAEEILAEAARLEAERNKQARIALQREIAALVAEQQAAFAARQELKKFEIVRARLVPVGVQGGPQRSLHVEVRNGTAHPVLRAHLEAIVERPGRAAPVLREELTFAMSRPLAPGESASLRLVPDAQAAWSAVDIPPDVHVRVAATRLDGVDGQVLFDAREYTEDDAARLVSLQYQLTMLAP
jgi:type IV pilus biogenesis protein CpaD/CtpE